MRRIVWAGPGKCRGCGARVWYDRILGWCELIPGRYPVKHRCPA